LQQTGQLLNPPEPQTEQPKLFDDIFRKASLEVGTGYGATYLESNNFNDREGDDTRAVISDKMEELAKAYPQLREAQTAVMYGHAFKGANVELVRTFKPEYKAAENAFTDWHRGMYPDPELDKTERNAADSMSKRQYMFYMSVDGRRAGADNYNVLQWIPQAEYSKPNYDPNTGDVLRSGPSGQRDYMRDNVPSDVKTYLDSITAATKEEDYSSFSYTSTKGSEIDDYAAVTTRSNDTSKTSQGGIKSAVLYNANFNVQTMREWNTDNDTTTRRYFSTPETKYASMVTHETGHVLHAALGSEATKEWGAIASSALDDAERKADTTRRFTPYASANAFELFAETFTMYNSGMTATMSGRMKSFFDRYVAGKKW